MLQPVSAPVQPAPPAPQYPPGESLPVAALKYLSRIESGEERPADLPEGLEVHSVIIEDTTRGRFFTATGKLLLVRAGTKKRQSTVLKAPLPPEVVAEGKDLPSIGFVLIVRP